jgi:hypothetical protein
MRTAWDDTRMHLLVALLVALPGVRTPTGNIECFYVPARPAHLLCSIRRADYTAAEQRASTLRAGLDWHGWEVYAAKPAQPVCSGGILYNSNRNVPRPHTLAYGRTWRYGPFACTSRITGLTCTSSSAHGIFISRQSWSRR